MTMDSAAPGLVLVVDDEPDIREFVAEVLSEAGFRIVTAGTGEEAVALAQAHRPALVLLGE